MKNRPDGPVTGESLLRSNLHHYRWYELLTCHTLYSIHPFIRPSGDYYKSPYVLSRAWDKAEAEDIVDVLKYYKKRQDSEREEWILFTPGVKNAGKRRLLKIPVGGGDESFQSHAMVVLFDSF